MKDLHNNIEVVSILPPIAISADQTFTDIDLAGWESAEIVIHIGLDAALAVGAYWDFVLYDSPDGTTYSVVETADVLGAGTITSGIILTVNSTDEDNAVYHFGYIGGQRYLQIVIDETGALTGVIGIELIKGNPQDKPVIA
jgi:hypothetical protein